MSFHKEVDTNNRFKFLIKAICSKILKLVGFKRIVNFINKSCKKVDYNKAKYCTILYSTISTKSKKYYEKEFFEKYIDVDFEREKVSILKEYDTILRDEYGDYMQLPPKEKRNSVHNIEVVKRKSNCN